MLCRVWPPAHIFILTRECLRSRAPKAITEKLITEKLMTEKQFKVNWRLKISQRQICHVIICDVQVPRHHRCHVITATSAADSGAEVLYVPEVDTEYPFVTAWRARLEVKSHHYKYKGTRVDGGYIQVWERYRTLSVMEKMGKRLFATIKGGIRAANLFWYLEKVCILQKTAYMSKKAFAPLYQAERDVKVDWATMLYDRMQLTGYASSIKFEDTGCADMLMEEGTKDLEEPESKMNFFTMGSKSKKSESKGKKITLFPKGIVRSARKRVLESLLAKEGSSASHGTMGIFSVEEATNYLVDLSKFLQTQDEALRVLENARLEHKCSVVLEGEMQKMSMQLLQEKSDKETLQDETVVDEQFKELDEKLATVTTENVLLINRLNPLAEMQKAVLQSQENVRRKNETLKIENERLVAEMEEMKKNHKEIEDSLSKLKEELSSGLLKPDQNLAVEAESDVEKQADPNFVAEKAVETDAE
ncbi:hypothetical protein L7F22_014479 [Adiantum nelumboides]|nr:hypothetical protein [Adiantum nelumboides]